MFVVNQENSRQLVKTEVCAWVFAKCLNLSRFVKCFVASSSGNCAEAHFVVCVFAKSYKFLLIQTKIALFLNFL